MPWLFNPTRDVHPVKLQDGTLYGFLPRKRVFISLNNMSAEVWRLVNARMLANQGGDPPEPKPVVQATEDFFVPVREEHKDKVADLVTSSIHHSADARVTVDSSTADHGEKETKAVKKQDDDIEKATSEKSEANLKKDTKTEKRGRSSRKRK
jgi:hypothetical protein